MIATDISNQIPAQKDIRTTSRIRYFTRTRISRLFSFMKRIVRRILGIIDGLFDIFDIGKAKARYLLFELLVHKQELKQAILIRENSLRRIHKVV